MWYDVCRASCGFTRLALFLFAVACPAGRRSFFSDESGVMHYTAADRAPTINDRVLP